MGARIAVIPGPVIGGRKGPLAVNPSHDRPSAALIAAPVLLAYDSNVHRVVDVADSIMMQW